MGVWGPAVARGYGGQAGSPGVGGALLRNLDVMLREETGLPIVVAENPLTAVVMGSGMALDQLDLLKEIAIDF